MCCSVKASFSASSPCTSTSTTLVSRASSTPTDPMLGEALVSDLDSCSSGMVERPLASLTNLNWFSSGLMGGVIEDPVTGGVSISGGLDGQWLVVGGLMEGPVAGGVSSGLDGQWLVVGGLIEDPVAGGVSSGLDGQWLVVSGVLEAVEKLV